MSSNSGDKEREGDRVEGGDACRRAGVGVGGAMATRQRGAGESTGSELTLVVRVRGLASVWMLLVVAPPSRRVVVVRDRGPIASLVGSSSEYAGE